MGNTNNDDDPGAVFAAFASLGIFALLIFLFVWGVFGTVAWFVAPYDRRWTFFWLTFLILGPFGVLAAAVASPRDPDFFAAVVAEGVEDALKRPRAEGRKRYWCSRCGAQSDLQQLKDNKCWRCGEERFIAAKSV